MQHTFGKRAGRQGESLWGPHHQKRRCWPTARIDGTHWVQALYEHVRNWISRAVSASALPSNARMKLAGASTHWLGHTFGTRAILREVPLDVIQAQMGHASTQTTMPIYRRAPIKRRSDELSKAFG